MAEAKFDTIGADCPAYLCEMAPIQTERISAKFGDSWPAVNSQTSPATQPNVEMNIQTF